MPTSIRQLLRWASFVSHHHPHFGSLKMPILLGAQYFFVDELPADRLGVMKECANCIGGQAELVKLNMADEEDGKRAAAATDEAAPKFSVVEEKEKPVVRMCGLGITAVPHPSIVSLDDLSKCVSDSTRGFQPVPSALHGFARIFASISMQTPLLLEGPPGTGKVAAIAALLSEHRMCRR